MGVFLQTYPQYNHTHLFAKSYRQGGLTQDQFIFLAKSAADRQYDDQRFQAALHGVKLKNNDKPASKKNPDGFLFGDPADYATMTPEEQQAATDKLLADFQGTAKAKGLNIPIKQVEKADG